jgi:hypothetical protein
MHRLDVALTGILSVWLQLLRTHFWKLLFIFINTLALTHRVWIGMVRKCEDIQPSDFN